MAAASRSVGPGVLCFEAGTVAGALEAAVPGQAWRLDEATILTGPITITGAGFRLVGGRIELPTADPWDEGVMVRADDVSIEGVSFRGGGVVVSVRGVDRVRVVGNEFREQVGTAIFLWGETSGADDALIESNRIVQTATRESSPLSSRGTEDLSNGVRNSRPVIRGNVIDQGEGGAGWFGIELKASPGALIEGNDVRGGSVLVSLPDSDGAIVRSNNLDMRGSPYWGVEVANSDDVVIDSNTFVGDGSGGQETAVSLNSESQRAIVSSNTVTGIRTLFDVSGDGHRVTGNCLTDVRHEFEHRFSGGLDIVFERNGPCG